MPSLNTGNAILSNAIAVNSSYNVGIGGAASGSFKLQVTGTGNLTGALTGTSATFNGNVGVKVSGRSESLAVEHSTGNVSAAFFYNNGIATGQSYGLTVYAGTNASDRSFLVANQGGANPYLYVRGDGNVGIGTNSPTAGLEIAKIASGGIGGILFLRNNASVAVNNAVEIAMAANSGGNASSPTARIVMTEDASAFSRLAFFTRDSGGVTERMRITSGGGINTYGPYLSMDGAGLTSPPAGLGYGLFPHSGVGLGISSVAVGISFWVGSTPTEKMRITSGGKVFIGTNSLGSSGTLNSYTNTGEPAGRFVSGPSTPDGNIVLLVDKYSSTNTTSQWFLGFTISNQGVASGVITANGASQAAFGSWSDRRLKENITDLGPQLHKILALRPVEFDYIKSEGGGHQISFIAQEFEEVYPDAVGERQDGMKTLTGWSKTEARLVKAIQELKAEINEQQQTINSLINR